MTTYIRGSGAVETKKLVATGTGVIKVPVGTTAQRPANPVVGMIRYNSTTSVFEVYNGSSWS